MLHKTLLRALVGISFVGISSPSFSASAVESLVPQEVVQGFTKDYTPQELTKIQHDYESIKKTSFHDKSSEQYPVYVASAGGPGASKTTILEHFMDKKANYVYIDPDQTCLRFMHTYRQDLSNLHIKNAVKVNPETGYQDLLRRAYTKWRGASNYISNTLLNEAFLGHYNIMHGTTSTAPTMEELYKKLKKQGYRIVLVLCGSSDENRKSSLEYRENKLKFYQATFDDYVAKGKMFYERFPVYFKYADEIHFFWTDEFLKGSEEVAMLDREKGFTITNQEKFDKFTDEYENNRGGLPLFEDLVKIATTPKK